MILVSAENAFGGDDSSMEASLMGSSSSKCDACIASFLLITLFYTQDTCEIRLFSIQGVPQSELLESPTPNKKKKKTKTKGAAKAKQWTKFAHSTPTECKSTTKKMKKRKRKTQQQQSTRLRVYNFASYHLATQKQKTDRWSDGKNLAREVTDRWCQCLPSGWIHGGNVAQIRAPLTR
jgi:hypothetical protein